MFGKTNKLHFIGIGGNGMSGIAELLINKGYFITGSDLMKTSITEKLEKMGAKIQYKHNADNVKDADVVVKSSAIDDSNCEIIAAKKKNIPVIRRAEMLYELMRMKHGFCIAGTHGKTTTTSMLGMILTEAGLQPTLVIGGVVKNFDSNAVLGKSEYIVVEADEYDRSFLTLTPIVAGITNIEEEHVDCYENAKQLESAFVQYANSVPFFGLIAVCSDDETIRKLIPRFEKRVLTYGINKEADVRAENITFDNFTSQYELIYKSEKLGTIELSQPGIHNVRNSLLAATIALEQQVPFIDIRNGLMKFRGVYRRFERIAFVNDILIYDDYAHHPTEVKATISAIRSSSARRLVVIFQPHLYTRTEMFYKKFAQVLSQADLIIIADIYPAREKPIKGVSGKSIFDELKKLGNKKANYIEDLKDIPKYLLKVVKSGDFVITMGAGDVYESGVEFVKLLEKKQPDKDKR